MKLVATRYLNASTFPSGRVSASGFQRKWTELPRGMVSRGACERERSLSVRLICTPPGVMAYASMISGSGRKRSSAFTMTCAGLKSALPLSSMEVTQIVCGKRWLLAVTRKLKMLSVRVVKFRGSRNCAMVGAPLVSVTTTTKPTILPSGSDPYQCA